MKNNILNHLPNKGNYAFVSPHIDDAIFSAGGLILKLLENGSKVTIINVFTAIPKGKNSLSAKHYIKQCGFDNAQDLYTVRQKEELDMSNTTGVHIVNLGHTEALWRTKKNLTNSNILAKVIPEVGLLYPIYKLNICSTRINKEDELLLNKITSQINNLNDTEHFDAIFGPIGFGNHVDHLVVKKAVLATNKKVFLWADYPYICRKQVNLQAVKNFKTLFYEPNWESKIHVMQQYKSQYKAIFDNVIPDRINEYYYDLTVKNNISSEIPISAVTYLKMLFKGPRELIYMFTYPVNKLVNISDYSESTTLLGESLINSIKSEFPNLVIHMFGSAALKVPGQKDVDLFAEASHKDFLTYMPYLISKLGKPFKTRRMFVEWHLRVDDIDVQFLLLDPETIMMKRHKRVFQLLKENIDKYREFKENALGISQREYEKRKLFFYYFDLKL